MVEEQTHLGSWGEGRQLLEEFKGLEEQLRGAIASGRPHPVEGVRTLSELELENRVWAIPFTASHIP